jgi:hypothetical protein
MTDYSEALIAARVSLAELERAASDCRYRDMAAHAHALEVNAEAIRFWAYSQPTPPEPTV